MRIGIVVSDFPKVTETFILRDLVHYHRAGHEIRIFHLTPYRSDEVVHGFAEQTLSWAVTLPFLFDRRVLGACLRALLRHPFKLFAIVWAIVREFATEPVNLLKSLAIVPKSLAMAEDLEAWQAAHVHAEFAGHPATAAWIVGRMSALPYSVSCHAHDIFRTQGLLEQKLSEATFVRCISRFNRDFLVERFPSLDTHAMPIIHVGVDTREIAPLEPASGEVFEILYIGSLEHRKGVSLLLRALAALPSRVKWRCDIVGGGPDLEALRAQSLEAGLQDRVTFHGPQPFEAVSRFMAACHLQVVPSVIGPGNRSEGIPTVIMEALAHRRPVIASRLSGIPELIEHGETGYLIEPGSVEELITAIVAVHDDPAAAHATASRGRELVEREFDMKTNAAARLELYRRHAVGS